ncbi:MAG: hypothetical protein ACJ75H_20390 [Thermoanaerobaculia bacterium]
MPTSSFRRKAALVLLAACLATATPAAALPQKPLEALRHSVLGRAWVFFSSLWSPPDLTKLGCDIDPNGLTSAPPAGPSDIGCNIDPNGRCVS